MPYGIAPRRLRPGFQTLQRKHLRGPKVPIAVLVMNRERLGRFPCHVRWTSPQIQ